MMQTMVHGRLARMSIVGVVIGLFLVGAPAWAQSSASGIAGIVKMNRQWQKSVPRYSIPMNTGQAPQQSVQSS